MSSKLILEQTLTDIADAIRSKAGTVDPINPADMPQAIEDMPSGGGDTLNDVLLAGTQKTYKNNTFNKTIRSSLFGAYGIENTSLEEVEFSLANGIADYAFYYCKALKSVTAPEVLSVGQNVFSSCNALTDISLPKCTSMGTQAFYQCANLESVSLPQLNYTAQQQFSTCPKLKTVDIPSAKNVADNCFLGCTGLTTFEGQSVQEIRPDAFYDCSNLQVVDIGRSLTDGYTDPKQLWNRAFENTALEALILRNTRSVQPLRVPNIFDNSPIASGTGYVYVPRALVSAYESATNWSTYSGQFRAIEDYTTDGTITGDFVMP